MFNQCTIEGRLTADPQKANTTNGTKAVRFAIANQRSKESTMFFNVVAYGNTAEFVSKYFSKGSPIIVSGPLEYEDTGNNGKKYRNCQIVVISLDFTVSNKPESAADNKEQTADVW